MSDMEEIKVVSGVMDFSMLNLSLFNEDRMKFDVTKIQYWLSMLNQGMEPDNWSVPTNRGTRVRWNAISTQKEYDAGLNGLQVFIDEINERHTLDFKIMKE